MEAGRTRGTLLVLHGRADQPVAKLCGTDARSRTWSDSKLTYQAPKVIFSSKMLRMRRRTHAMIPSADFLVSG